MSRIEHDPLFEDLPLQEALARARAGRLQVVASFFAAWCLPSRRLLTSICAHPGAVEYLRERAIVVRIDGEEQPELRERYGIEAYPTLLVLSDEGTELGRSVGHVEPEELVERIAAMLRERGARAAAADRDPVTLLRRARRLAEAGDEAEALASLLALFSSTATPDRLRFGFVLQEIVELGRAYPPAIAALRAARDEREHALVTTAASPRAAVELAALDEALDDAHRSLKILDRLKTRGHQDLTRAFAERLAPLLRRHGRYEDLYRHAGRSAWFFRREMRRAVEGSEAWWSRFLVEAGCCYETTLALGHDAEAQEIADSALAQLSTLQTFATLLDAALAADRAPVARALLERARESLDQRDAQRLERRLASA